MEYRTRRPLRQAAPAENERAIIPPFAKTVPLQKLYRKKAKTQRPDSHLSASAAVCLKPLHGAGLALPWCSFNQKRGFMGLKPAATLCRQRNDAQVQHAVQESAW
ncbi:hypothetical protein AL522_12575 [Pantoea vagans]|nr:hypothetical protein AL522_12575 [Pantoea vagans]